MPITDPLRTISTRVTPQGQPARADQVKNNAGGFVFEISDLERLRRFLTFGVEGRTYYVTQKALTRQHATFILRMAASDPRLVVDEVVAISTAGRAPKQNPALFALAVVAGTANDEGRAYALRHLNAVARTGTHLAQFATYIQQFRGWGRALRRAISQWYLDKTPEALAYQVLKYRNRDGWTHRDLLRQAHPETTDPAHAKLFDYITHRRKAKKMHDQSKQSGLMVSWTAARDKLADDTTYDLSGLPELVTAFEEARTASPARIVELIGDHPLSWEMLPTEALNSVDVWAALVDKGMPITALVRQLPRLTHLGVLADRARRQAVVERLSDPALLAKGRVHPISLLVALHTYASGCSARGQGAWEPLADIVDGLDAAFYAAFDTLEPTGKRTLLALDVSGSMTTPVSGLPLTAREASAAMAMATARTEQAYEIVSFTSADGHPLLRSKDDPPSTDEGIHRLPLSPRQRLDDVVRSISDLPFGATDCALPMIWAEKHQVAIDTFVIYTDSETWAGDIQPWQALRRKRTSSPPVERSSGVSVISIINRASAIPSRRNISTTPVSTTGAASLRAFDIRAARVTATASASVAAASSAAICSSLCSIAPSCRSNCACNSKSSSTDPARCFCCSA